MKEGHFQSHVWAHTWQTTDTPKIVPVMQVYIQRSKFL